MYLKNLWAENFRLFGSCESGTHLNVEFNRGLNILVGENDSGKTAVIDAIRFVLYTTSMEFLRIDEDDFHTEDGKRATELHIQLLFSKLTVEEQARYLEWLTLEEGELVLYINVRASVPSGGFSGSNTKKLTISTTSGKDGNGPRIDSDIRDFLRCTFLKPLRDAEAELSAGRGSRLARILESHKDFVQQKVDDCDPQNPTQSPKTLVGIVRQAEHGIEKNTVVQGTKEKLNTSYLSPMSLSGTAQLSNIGIAQQSELRQILEKLELFFVPDSTNGHRTQRGLGYNNLLFMATELLLLGEGDNQALPLLLIEEPEAHLHPQLQARLMQFLEEKAASSSPIQVIVTTHSPNLASLAAPERIHLLSRGKSYSLAIGHTKLEPQDYRFLRRFLDVTKANLFFARGVIIVEGDAENLLLPVFARKIGRPLEEYGVSIVNVGHRGLFRYSRILRRQDGSHLPIPVACIADRDIVPDNVDYAGDKAKKMSDFTAAALTEHDAQFFKNDGENVRTFVSPLWTLEYDLASTPLQQVVHMAVLLAKQIRSKGDETLTLLEIRTALVKARKEISEWNSEGKSSVDIAAQIYKPLKVKSASKSIVAQLLAELIHSENRMSPQQYRDVIPKYLVDAIEYATGNHPVEG